MNSFMPPTIPVDSGSLVNTSITIHFCELHGNPGALVSNWCMCSVPRCHWGFLYLNCWFIDTHCLPVVDVQPNLAGVGLPSLGQCVSLSQNQNVFVCYTGGTVDVNYSYPSTFQYLANLSPWVWTSQHFISHPESRIILCKPNFGFQRSSNAAAMPKNHQTVIQPRFRNATVNLVVPGENNAGWCVGAPLCVFLSKEMPKKYTPKVLLPWSKMCLWVVMDFSLDILVTRQTTSPKSLEIQFSVLQEAAHSRWLQITSYNCYSVRARSISIARWI